MFLTTPSLHSQWVALGPPGPVSSLARFGTMLVAGSLGGGVSVSTDDGRSWYTTNAGLTNLKVSSVAATSRAIFAATFGKGVFASADAGKTWIPTGIMISSYVGGLSSVASKLFAGPVGYGAFYSPNDGLNWFPAGKGLATGSVNQFTSAGSTLFAGTQSAGVFISTDGGGHWTASNYGMTEPYVIAIVTNSAGVFAGTFGRGVFRSTDTGATWFPVNGGLLDMYVLCLASATPVEGGSTLLAGTASNGLFASTDNGTSWSLINLGLLNNSVGAVVADGSSAFAGTSEGVYKSSDAGAHWISLGGGPSADIAALSVIGGNLYAGANGSGVFVSTNGGFAWTRLSRGLGSGTIASLVAKGSTLFAGTAAGVFSLDRDSAVWRSAGLNDQINVLAASGGTLLAGRNASGVYYSTDDGTSWHFGQGTVEDLAGTIIKSFVTIPSFVFAGSDGKGVYRSTDNGAHWTKANEGLPDLHVQALEVQGLTLYAATGRGVYFSVDSGATWTITYGNGLQGQAVNTLTNANGALLAGTSTNGVYGYYGGSTDLWRTVNAGLPVRNVRALLTNGDYVYAGTAQGGVCRRLIPDILRTLGVEHLFGLPSGFALSQNYPNPFNPSTTITYTIPGEGIVRLSVFDILGREVDRLVEGKMPAGSHTIEWRPAASSGIYFYRLEVRSAGGRSLLFTQTRKMIVVR